MSRVRLFKRAFGIDDEHGPNCDGRRKIIASIEYPAVIVAIVTFTAGLRACRRVPGY